MTVRAHFPPFTSVDEETVYERESLGMKPVVGHKLDQAFLHGWYGRRELETVIKVLKEREDGKEI